MKSILLAITATLTMGMSAQAADIVCSCTNVNDVNCTDISINFIPSNPGVYMTIAYGDKNTEGFATVTRQKEPRQTVFRLANFVLVEQDNKYSLPGRPFNCN